MRSAKIAAVLATAIVLSACGGEAPSEAPEMGNARLRFAVSNGAKSNRNLTDPLFGNVYGAVFHREDVTVTGPIEGAERVSSCNASAVDLREFDQSEQDCVTEQVPPGMYIFLGFFDVDGNGEASHDPDGGDPVTLPVNEFAVKPGLTTPVVVSFDLIYN